MKNSSSFERAGARLARCCGPRDQLRLPCAQKPAKFINLRPTTPAPQSSLNPLSTHGRGDVQQVLQMMKCECAARAWTPGRVYAREARQERGGHAPHHVQRPPDRRRRQRGDDDVQQSSKFLVQVFVGPGCMQTLFILMSWVTLSSPLEHYSPTCFHIHRSPKTSRPYICAPHAAADGCIRMIQHENQSCAARWERAAADLAKGRQVPICGAVRHTHSRVFAPVNCELPLS